MSGEIGTEEERTAARAGTGPTSTATLTSGTDEAVASLILTKGTGTSMVKLIGVVIAVLLVVVEGIEITGAETDTLTSLTEGTDTETKLSETVKET